MNLCEIVIKNYVDRGGQVDIKGFSIEFQKRKLKGCITISISCMHCIYFILVHGKYSHLQTEYYNRNGTLNGPEFLD